MRDCGQPWNRKRVAWLMRTAGIEGIHRRWCGKYGRRAASTATVADLVERDFTAPAPDQLGRRHPYLRTWEGFLYLAVAVDACSRRVVGWVMADHLRAELVLDAIGFGCRRRRTSLGWSGDAAARWEDGRGRPTSATCRQREAVFDLRRGDFRTH